MKHTVSVRAVCPYYRHENSQMIYCDGAQDGSVVHLAFSNKIDSRGYKKQYCQKNYESCKIFACCVAAEDKKAEKAPFYHAFRGGAEIEKVVENVVEAPAVDEELKNSLDRTIAERDIYKELYEKLLMRMMPAEMK